VRDFGSNDEDHNRLHGEFLAFRTRGGIYREQMYNVGLDPHTFWTTVRDQDRAALLPPIAQRLFGCIANSVPSERAFSYINFLKDNLSNRLESTNLNMIMFIYMNTRVLRRIGVIGDATTNNNDQLTEDEL